MKASSWIGGHVVARYLAERIVGIASGGSGVAIHAIDCPALARFEDKPELWIDLHWHVGKHAAVYPTGIENYHK